MATPASDEQLLGLMLSGDAEAFGEIYDRRQGGIFRYALRMTGSEAIAEDVTHDVFLELMRDGGQFDDKRGSLKSYLFGMARHRVLRRLKVEKNIISIDGQAEDDEPFDDQLVASADPFMELARGETVGLVRQAILSLPPHFREVIVLCELQELNYLDAAKLIDCPIGTVRSRLNRARTLLVEKLRVLQPPGVAESVEKAGQAL
ncbi:MAG TPA: RNA polymerase sigma factor [Pyrinomonadaceae bacterium]|nr:RNA polymerase sigma factor [Pyrinomonadaceae bacterium]